MWQTSALDTHTEQALLQNINDILKEKDRTSVFIAHRLRTIYDADLIIVLQDGQVAESGTHDQLITKGGLYWHLWSSKFFSFVKFKFLLRLTTNATFFYSSRTVVY
jgi:ATP-binding cassette subfamily B (MDR/TAP) protein 7